jgi:ectoine hydroxylase-related dioxygenase (phytanoyl-CoA dioxygenase family)
MLTEAQRQQFHDDGYVIIDEAVEPAMLEPLRAATGRVTERTRAGEWPHKRGAPDNDIWGVSHLLHPDLDAPIFADYMASAPVLDVAADLLDTPELRLELVNMLVNPARAPHKIGWHRDLLRREVLPEEEITILRQLQDGIQWNTALYDEACLLIVPGTHRRCATEEERDVQFRRPMDPIPGQLAVELKAGQGVYYNSQLIHRGIYPHDRRRETIHACMHVAGSAAHRNYYYDSLKWMDTPGFRDRLPARLQPLYDNWLRDVAEHRGAPSPAV